MLVQQWLDSLDQRKRQDEIRSGRYDVVLCNSAIVIKIPMLVRCLQASVETVVAWHSTQLTRRMNERTFTKVFELQQSIKAVVVDSFSDC